MDRESAIAVAGSADARKIAVLGLIGIAGCIVVRKLYLWIKEKADEGTQRRAAEAAVEKTKGQTTLTKEEAESVAKALFQSFNYEWGTDLETFDRQMDKIKNAADWYCARKAFGTSGYGYTGTPMWGQGDKLDLIGWCRKELSGGRLAKCEELNDEANRMGLGGVTAHGLGCTLL